MFNDRYGLTQAVLNGTKTMTRRIVKGNNIMKELVKWWQPCQTYGIFLSFTTDPLIEGTLSLTGFAIREASIRGIPVYVLTKNATFFDNEVFRYYVFYVPYNLRKRIHFGFTLTGHDDMEPNASTNKERIHAMRDMASLGFSTFASIEPVIDWQSAKDVVIQSLPWCQHYKIGLRSGVKKDYYDVYESFYSISEIIGMASKHERTVYLKESTRKLLCQRLSPEVMDQLLSKTVDMDGVKIPLHVTLVDGSAIPL